MQAAHDACKARRISFILLPIEAFGGCHVAVKHTARLGRDLSRSLAGVSQYAHLFQRLALFIQKGNAALIISRSTGIHSYDMLGEC